MINKITIYHNLKRAVAEKEKEYNNALNDLEICLSRINKGVIHGRKEQNCLNDIKPIISRLTRASFQYELACHKLNSFVKNGVVTYEQK